MDNVIVRIIDMPLSVQGMTVVDADGNYNVYLNSKGDLESAFIHELSHILNNDFYTEDGIQAIENRAEMACLLI